jgi:hypothetical protein
VCQPTLHLSRRKKYDIELFCVVPRTPDYHSHKVLRTFPAVSTTALSSIYPPPRASIEFSLPRLFPALPQWFSCDGHYHFSEDNRLLSPTFGCETCILACENISFTWTDVETSTLQNYNLPILQASLNSYPYNLVHDMLRVLNSSTLLVRHHHLRISDRHQLIFVNQLKKTSPPLCVCEKNSASQCALFMTVPLVPDGHFRLRTPVQLCVSYQKTNVFN